MQFLLSPSKARGSDASSARGSRGVDDVGEIIICCIDDGDDGDEVGLWEKGGRSNLYFLREKLEGVLLLEIGDAR